MRSRPSMRELVPAARIGVGHGQMGEGELEKIMLAFMRHEADILLPRPSSKTDSIFRCANTIIINRADRHGL